MMISKDKSLKFINEMQKPIISKELIFEALFETCGTGKEINTKHVFFQEVIIKFNASKAVAVITNHMPYETESHYVDVALYAYIRSGYSMKNFNQDLEEFRAKYQIHPTIRTTKQASFANA